MSANTSGPATPQVPSPNPQPPVPYRPGGTTPRVVARRSGPVARGTAHSLAPHRRPLVPTRTIAHSVKVFIT